MGIRFRCQACTNKVNVKDFLAGKRGICPKCGAKFTIPEQSDPEFQATPDEPEQDPAPAANPSIVVTTPSAAVGGMPVAAPIAAATSAGHSPQTSSAQVYAAPQFSAPQQPQQPNYAPAMPAAGYPAGPRDPFAEAPNAQWYVRHASGQQYGPAPAPTMQKWLAEGRVPGDGMVWREGWADWLVASMVFPQLTAPPVPVARGPVAAPFPPQPGMFPGPAAPAPAPKNDPFSFGGSPASGSSNTASQFVHQRRDNSKMMLVISIILFIAIAVVGGVLWYVLTKPQDDEEEVARQLHRNSRNLLLSEQNG
jgi:hypothetical protein